MVRVFSIYQFNGQSIHRISGDIQSASLIDANQLALAKSDHVIEIVSLQNENYDETTPGNQHGFDATQTNDSSNIRTKYAFPTVDEVIEMVYCKSGTSTVHTVPSNNDFFCDIHFTFFSYSFRKFYCNN